MNKPAIKTFAVWARKELIAAVSQKAYEYGIGKESVQSADPSAEFIGGRLLTKDEIRQRGELISQIKAKGFEQVMEEIAYTWFNRFIALRFMEVNGYLPTRVRVFTDHAGNFKPEILADALHLDLEGLDKDKLIELVEANNAENLYKYLLITQCNALNAGLPDMFEKISNYTELLFPNNMLKADSVPAHMVADIPEEDWREAVEIIGWMYQYYISEKHEEVINIYKGTVKKEDIPAATQLFTTDWVVRYMVDNSLGKYWLERNPASRLKEKLAFYLEPKDGVIEYIEEKIEPKDLTFFDPCMGSGHILVYAFEVLMAIYKECGYSESDAAVSIIQNNLSGLDIDDRASQLAYFAVMMKARCYNRQILAIDISPNICAIQESNGINAFACDGVTNDRVLNKTGEYLVEQFRHAKEIGSLQTIEAGDYNRFTQYLLSCENTGQIDFSKNYWFKTVRPLMFKLTRQAEIMSRKYAVVATNPPYMNKLESHLKDFVTSKYKEYSGDLFSAYIYRNFDFCKPNGYSAFMSPFVWMFIKTYENLRSYIIKQKSISSLIQMEYSAFEEATVPICSFVLKNSRQNTKGMYIKLSEFKGGMEVQKRKVLEAIANKNCGYWYETNSSNFTKIPGMPIAYWISSKVLGTFDYSYINEKGTFSYGVFTCNNEIFLKLWYECNFFEIDFAKGSVRQYKKWCLLNKGGGSRKWYGNLEYIINYGQRGERIKAYRKSKGQSESLPGEEYYFRKHISWSLVTSGKLTFRYYPEGLIFDISAPSMFCMDIEFNSILAILNSKLGDLYLPIFNPTMNNTNSDIKRIPFIEKAINKNIDNHVNQNILLSKTDWDSFETSWDFTKHPLI